MFIKILQIIPIVALIANNTYGMQSLVDQQNSSLMNKNTSREAHKCMDVDDEEYLRMLKEYRDSDIRKSVWILQEYEANDPIYDNVRPQKGPTLLRAGWRVEYKSDTPSDISSKSSVNTSLGSSLISIFQKRSNNSFSIKDNFSLENIKIHLDSKLHTAEKVHSDREKTK